MKRLFSLFRERRLESAFTDELRLHLDLLTEEFVKKGMSPHEARWAAQREFGAMEPMKDHYRLRRGVPFLETLSADIRISLRNLRRNPVFTVAVLASLALGIGANTAIFSFVNALLLKTLPVANPRQLVLFEQSHGLFGLNEAFSFQFFQEIERRNHALSGVLARFPLTVNLVAGQTADNVDAELVSSGYFRTLDLHPTLGRLLDGGDNLTENGHPVCVLSYDAWQTRFGGDTRVVDRVISLNRTPFQIVGVAPAGFHGAEFAGNTSVFLPISMTSALLDHKLDDATYKWLEVMGRLRPGITRARASVEIDSIGRQIESDSRLVVGINVKNTFALGDGDQGLHSPRGDFQKPILVLMTIVILVLAIACANAANLLLARALERRKETAMRLALGASRGRLIRSLLVESLLLSMAGGALGLLTGAWMMSTIRSMLASNSLPGGYVVHLDGPVVAFTFFLSLATGLIFGLLPAWQSSSTSLTAVFAGGRLIGSCGGSLVRRGLVVAQIALSLVLVFAAALFGRSLRNLQTIDLGLRPENVYSFSFNPGLSGYADSEVPGLLDRLLSRAHNAPGIESASVAKVNVLSGGMMLATVKVPGFAHRDQPPLHYFNHISPGYFYTLRTRLLRGRDFDSRDSANAPPVAIINERFASYYWPGQDPVGRHFQFARDTQEEVVGVVKNARYRGVEEEPPLTVYLPLMQHPASDETTLQVRSTLPPEVAFARIRELFHAVDPKLPIDVMTTLEAQINRDLSQERTLSFLSSAFGGLATLLAAIGLYGVLVYSVTRRTREFGIRIALGGESREVVWLIIREVVVLLAIGVGIGLIAALASSRVVASLLYNVKPQDPTLAVLAIALLGSTALLAGFLPARRASRVDPANALREE